MVPIRNLKPSETPLMFLFPDPHLSEAQKRRETEEDNQDCTKQAFDLIYKVILCAFYYTAIRFPR